jgi:hypothetical protein
MATLIDLARQGVISLELGVIVSEIKKVEEQEFKRRVKIENLGKKAKYEFENAVVSSLAGHYLSWGEIAILLLETWDRVWQVISHFRQCQGFLFGFIFIHLRQRHQYSRW